VKAYFDTSFLVSAYVRDGNSAKVAGILKTGRGPLLCTPLVELEMRNAVRLCAFREELTAAQCRAVLRDIDTDLADGVLWSPPFPWEEGWREAESLGSAFTARLGTRSLDLLHVAAARVLGARAFYSFDHRQARLAADAGLKALPS
jgi:predicted nucleic acid-binding protein